MRIPATPRRGDILRYEVRGQRWWAEVIGRELQTNNLRISSLAGSRTITQTTIRPRQVIGYWRGAKGSVI